MNIGYVYKLCIKDGSIDDCYVGSTKNIKIRKTQHKFYCTHEYDPHYNNYCYKFIREHGSWDNWTLHILEEVKYNSKIELLKRERYWIENLNASLNKIIPTQTINEWNDKNNDKLLIKAKKYRESHIEKIKEYREKLKIKVNCEICNELISIGSLNRHINRKHKN